MIRILIIFLLLANVAFGQLTAAQGPLFYNQRTQTPSIVQQGHGVIALASSFVVTPASTVTPGTLMVQIFGGSQTRGVTPPSGWGLGGTATITALSGGGTLEVWLKIATGSEPSSYTWTITGGTLQGAYSFYELANATTLGPDAAFYQDDGVTSTSFTFPSYAVTGPAIVFIIDSQKNNSTFTGADSGFTTANQLTQRFGVAHKIYTASDPAETPTMSFAGNQLDLEGRLIIYGN